MKFTLLSLAFVLMLSQTSTAQQKEKIVYPLVISFQSQCCGVPSDSALRNFIKAFKKQNKIKKIIADHIGPMGREGEYYLAFKLKELNKKQAASFIKKIKKIEKLPSDKGDWSFKEKEEIDPSSLPGRASMSQEIF